MDPPPIRYADRDGARLAYQVIGHGEANVVWLLELNNHLDLLWTDPHLNALFERISSYATSAAFQRRGVGVSDPIDYVPTLEQWASDVIAVMDAAGMPSATLVGNLCTCAAAVVAAATYPDRVRSLTLINPLLQSSTTGRPLLGLTPADLERIETFYRNGVENWGQADLLPLWESAIDTPFNRRLFGLLERCSASRDAARAYAEAALTADVTDLLASVKCPVRALRTASGIFPTTAIEAIADAAPDGSYAVLPVPLPGTSLGESLVPWIEDVRTFVTGAPRPPDADRRVATMVFTDLVGSTELLATIGDTAYRELRATHERAVRLAVEVNGGQLINVTGDGTVSIFDVASKAVRAACTIRDEALDLGVAVRAGIHTGEVDWSANDLSGLAVHIGARVGATAGAGEILASSTVRDLLYGSSLAFRSTGHHELRGVPDTWELFTVDDGGDRPTVAVPSPEPTMADRAALRTARTLPSLARFGVRLGGSMNRRRHGVSVN